MAIDFNEIMGKVKGFFNSTVEKAKSTYDDMTAKKPGDTTNPQNEGKPGSNPVNPNLNDPEAGVRKKGSQTPPNVERDDDISPKR